MNPPKTIDAKFFSDRSKRDETTGCIEWQRHTNQDGYGTLKHRGKQHMAHRAMWTFARGPIPTGMLVCHRCDNPRCINPDHLFLGTTQDNVDDKMKKGRFIPLDGERNGYATLTADQVSAIRDDLRPQSVTAEAFGTSQGNVSLIKRGATWASVEYMPPADKRLTVKEFAALCGVEYMPLKDRIYGNRLTMRESLVRGGATF
jgi:hypothetical protein